MPVGRMLYLVDKLFPRGLNLCRSERRNADQLGQKSLARIKGLGFQIVQTAQQPLEPIFALFEPRRRSVAA